MLDIWDEMRAMERRLDDFFRTFAGPRGWLTFPAIPRGLRRPFIPATDVFARNGDLMVRAELPGVDPEKDIALTLEKGELVVKGQRKRAEEIEEESYYRAEASYGAFERRVPVPEGTTEKDIEARYEDGVLEVTVKKAAEVSPPKATAIPVHSAKAEKGKKTEAA